LYYSFKGVPKVEPIQTAIQSILYIAAYGYLMLVFIDYFRFHRLKVLQITTIVILMTEIIRKGYSIVNALNPPVPVANTLNLPMPRLLFITISTIYIISLIIWMIFLFQSKTKHYPAIQSIRKYAVTIMLYLILWVTIPNFVKADNRIDIVKLLSFIAAIPYIFIIGFAVKMPLKE
jgi:hypothetical protein